MGYDHVIPQLLNKILQKKLNQKFINIKFRVQVMKQDLLFC